MCARSPAHDFEVSEPTISVHLKILKSAGLIIGEKKSFYMHCHVVREHIENLTQFLCKLSAQAALKERHCLPGPVNGNALKEKTITGK